MILFDPDLDPAPQPHGRTRRGGRGGDGPALKRASDRRASVPPPTRLPSARTLERFLGFAQKAVRLRGQVSVLLTTDTAIRNLNRRFRGKNQATDVLSFPADGVGAKGIAGDLAISVSRAARQAAAHGHPLSAEIKVLILHGLLHLGGYDHEADQGRMAGRERQLRARLGLPQGLIERSGYKSPAKVRRTAGARSGGL